MTAVLDYCSQNLVDYPGDWHIIEIYRNPKVNGIPKNQRGIRKEAITVSVNDEFRRVLLAGVGALAETADRAKEIVEELVKQGELTLEQGKVLSEDFKSSVKESVQQYVNDEAKEEISSLKARVMELERELSQLKSEEEIAE